MEQWTTGRTNYGLRVHGSGTDPGLSCLCNYEEGNVNAHEGDVDAMPWRLKAYMMKHILTPGHDSCPLVSQERSDILHNYSLAHIFSTEAGGQQLSLFLHRTQHFLRPLPPRPLRPDPP